MPQDSFSFIEGAAQLLAWAWDESHDEADPPLSINEKAHVMVCEVLNPWLANCYRRRAAAGNPPPHNPYVT